MPKRPRPRPRPAGLIAELPLDERPRERLLRNGPKALTDAELVAILLKNGRPGASVLEVAREILVSAGGLPGLAGACARSLRRNGVGQVKLATLLAAVEIAARMALAAVPDRQPLSRPGAVAKYIDLRYGRLGQEILGVLYVNAKGDLLEERELYRGTQHRASVEPREILRRGLLCGAAGVVMWHCHPSGDPAPSREDIAFTRRMAKACEVVGIELVDHMVVGAGGAFVSMKARGGW